MSPASPFATFVRSSCGGLIRNLADTLDTTLAVLDPEGEVVFEARNGDADGRAADADSAVTAPIEAGGDAAALELRRDQTDRLVAGRSDGDHDGEVHLVLDEELGDRGR